MYEEENDRTHELEWMLQNSQVDDAMLLEALVGEHYSAVAQLALFILNDPAKITYAAGMTFTNAVAYRHRYTGEQPLKAWLLAIAYRACSRLQRLRKPLLQPAFTGESAPDAFRATGETRQDEFLLPVLEVLGEKRRQILLLHYCQELTVEETAYVVKTSRRKVHAALEQARRTMLSQPNYPEIIRSTAPAGDSFSVEVVDLEELNASRGNPHEQARAQLRSGLDGISDEGVQRIDHLQACRQCTDYRAALTVFEDWLKLRLQGLWPPPAPDESDLKRIMEEIDSRQAQPRFLFIPLKELTFSLVVVALVILLGWYGRLMQPEPEATVVVIKTREVTRLAPNIPDTSSTATPPPFIPPEEENEKSIFSQLGQSYLGTGRSFFPRSLEKSHDPGGNPLPDIYMP